MNNDELAARMRGAYIPVEIQSIQDCPSYNCFIVNDLVLLSYGEARFILERNIHCNRLAKVFTNRFFQWCVIGLYNLFCYSVRQPEYMIIKQKERSIGT